MGDHIKNNELGTICSMYGAEDRCTQSLVGNLREREDLKDTGINGKFTLKCIIK
jgi:hypothetical protein